MQELQKELTGKGAVWPHDQFRRPKNSSHRTPEQAQKNGPT